jgi:hypothetical protein
MRQKDAGRADFILHLNEAAADLGQAVRGVLHDLGGRGDGVAGVNPAARHECAFSAGLGALKIVHPRLQEVC